MLPPPRDLTPEVPYFPGPKTSGSSVTASVKLPASFFAESTQMIFSFLVCFAEDDPISVLMVIMLIFMRPLYFLRMAFFMDM